MADAKLKQKEKKKMRAQREKEAMQKSMEELAKRDEASSLERTAEENSAKGGSSRGDDESSVTSSDAGTGSSTEELPAAGYLGGMLSAVSSAIYSTEETVENTDPQVPEPSADEIARNAAIRAELGLDSGTLEKGYLTAALFDEDWEEDRQQALPSKRTGTKQEKKEQPIVDVLANSKLKAYALGKPTGIASPVSKPSAAGYMDTDHILGEPALANDPSLTPPTSSTPDTVESPPSEPAQIDRQSRKRSNSREDRGKRMEAERALTRERENAWKGDFFHVDVDSAAAAASFEPYVPYKSKSPSSASSTSPGDRARAGTL